MKKYLLLLLLMTFGVTAQEKAVIVYPVIEMNNSFPPTPDNSPICPDTDMGCKRSHQGLHNEVVDIIEQKDTSVKISYKNIAYRTDGSLSTFWVDAKNIIRLKDLENSEVLQTIPHVDYGQEPTVVLIYPWKNFSVGTRFKHVPAQDGQFDFAIMRGDYTNNSVVCDSIPHDCAIQEIQQDAQSSRKLFVENVRNLIARVALDNPSCVIPYVWGGSSFIYPYVDTDFYSEDGFWQRQGQRDPYTGYDCSELVMRMAQIAGLNFPWKTTTAIKNSKRPLGQHDILENGDLIWIAGHVMIVSDIEQNELIEARGYGSGYGCIHTIKLNEIFQDVVTYDDLLTLYYAHASLNLKKRDGEFLKTVGEFLLLKLID